MRTLRRATEEGASAFAVTFGVVAAWLAPHILAAAWESWTARRRKRREERYNPTRRARAILQHNPATLVEFRQHPDTRGCDLYVDQVFVGALALTREGRHMVEDVLLPQTESTRRGRR